MTYHSPHSLSLSLSLCMGICNCVCMHARRTSVARPKFMQSNVKKKTTGASKTPQTLSKSDGTTNGEGTQRQAGRYFENGLRRGFDVDGVDDITVFATLFPFNSIVSIFVVVFPLYLLTLFLCSISIFFFQFTVSLGSYMCITYLPVQSY